MPSDSVSEKGSVAGTPENEPVAPVRRHPVLTAFRSLTRHALDTLLLLDRHGHVIETNRPFAGLAAEMLRGQPFDTFVEAQQRPALRVAIDDALHPGLAHRVELAVHERGRTVWYRGTTSPVDPGDDQGRPQHVLVRLTDVTTERAEEERLRRSERLMTDTQGVAHLGTWEWDISEPHARWSDELYQIYGLDPKDHTPTYQDYLTRVHPDDRDRVMVATEAVLKDHKPYSHDERIHRTDGEWRYLHTWAYPVFDESGQLRRLVGVCQDVTDRKRAELAVTESEARFRAIFERSPLGLATVESDGGFLQTNPELETMLGLGPTDLQQRTLLDLAHPDDREKAAAALRATFTKNEGPQVEMRLVGKAGTDVWVHLSMAPVAPAGPDDEPFAVAVVEDLSAQLKAEEASRLAEVRLGEIQRLEDVSQWKTRLLGIASHELKNPLAPISLQLHILRNGRFGQLSDKQKGAVDRIERQVDRLNSLIGSMLDVSRVEHGKLDVVLESTDIAALVHEAIETYREAADEWGIRIAADVQGLEEAVRVDPERLQQAVHNLLSNAFKFTPNGGTVTVRAVRHGDEVVIEVQDSGPGMDAEQQGKLFKPFSQVHERTDVRERGTGLGLFIAKGIVEAHGGAIGVESQPGMGSTFRIRIPAHAGAA